MNIAIYQIDPDRDENNVAFLNYESQAVSYTHLTLPTKLEV